MPFVTGPKERKSRALGENLFLKAERSGSQKSAMTRRPYPPGMHGKRRRNYSEYSLQLKEKQKIRLFYGLQEKQMKKYVDVASSSRKISAPEALLRELELRLDSMAYRSGLAPSRSVARQLVGHGHLSLNGRRVNIPSMRLKIGDQVAVVESSKAKKVFEPIFEKMKKYESPIWLELDKDKKSFIVRAFPDFAEVNLKFNLPMVIEFYSR